MPRSRSRFERTARSVASSSTWARCARTTSSSRRVHAIAIGWRDEQLVVAVADPSNAAAIDDIRAATRRQLLPVVATRAAIEAALDALAAGEVQHREVEQATQPRGGKDSA